MYRLITRRARAVGAPGARRQRPLIAALAIFACTSLGLALPGAASAGGPNGGGGAVPAPVLPADLPASFPIPPGTLTASNGTSPYWTVGLFESADPAVAHQAIVDFYVAHGFHWDRTPFDDSTLHNGSFMVSFVARTNDTSAGVGAGTSVALGISATSGAPAPSGTTPPPPGGAPTTPGTTKPGADGTSKPAGRGKSPKHHGKAHHRRHGAKHRPMHPAPSKVKNA